MAKYKCQDHPDIQACICKEGFSVIQATINLPEWGKVVKVEYQVIIVDLLFELGLLKEINHH